jgi:hypothetical protein
MNAMREVLKVQGVTLTVSALLLFLVPGCITEPDPLDNDASNVLVQIVSMGGAPSDLAGVGDTVSDLLSDVCFADEEHPPCTVFNDNGVVVMRAFPKDRTQTVSDINDVTFTRYRVTFIRADGRNVQGVDVPFAFDGVAQFTVPISGEEVERPFIIVRHQAKAESPLKEISQNRALILSVIAQVDFYGADSSGRAVQVTGYVNITFADFANE